MNLILFLNPNTCNVVFAGPIRRDYVLLRGTTEIESRKHQLPTEEL